MYLVVFKIVLILCVLLSVAFYTLFERKLLGYAQTRVGPNKVSIAGLLQPLGDAAKLVAKKEFSPQNANKWVYFLAPILRLILSLIGFSILVDSFTRKSIILGVILFIFVLSLGVFPVCLSGWSRNREYATLGGVRSLAQTVSYEVALFLLVITPFFASIRLRFILNKDLSWGLAFPISMLLYIIVLLAETNRAPFDLSEGERELVSGFNIEYGGAGFTLFFLAEYAIIILISLWLRILFTGRYWWRVPAILILLIIRSAYPRIRYDSLIMFSWLICLPMITAACILAFSI